MAAINAMTNQELVALVENLQAEQHGDMALTPLGLLEALSAHVLARNIPEKAAFFLSRERRDIETAFVKEVLLSHKFPASIWLEEDEQRRLFGGIETLLFDNLPDGIFERYALLANRVHTGEDSISGLDAEI